MNEDSNLLKFQVLEDFTDLLTDINQVIAVLVFKFHWCTLRNILVFREYLLKVRKITLLLVESM